MTNLLNEEIMAIKQLMAHLEKAIPLETDSGRKHKSKKMYEDASYELRSRLEQCEDYKG